MFLVYFGLVWFGSVRLQAVDFGGWILGGFVMKEFAEGGGLLSGSVDGIGSRKRAGFEPWPEGCGLRNAERVSFEARPGSRASLRLGVPSVFGLADRKRDRRRNTQNSNLQQDRLDGHGPNWRFFTLQSLRENKNK